MPHPRPLVVQEPFVDEWLETGLRPTDSRWIVTLDVSEVASHPHPVVVPPTDNSSFDRHDDRPPPVFRETGITTFHVTTSCAVGVKTLIDMMSGVISDPARAMFVVVSDRISVATQLAEIGPRHASCRVIKQDFIFDCMKAGAFLGLDKYLVTTLAIEAEAERAVPNGNVPVPTQVQPQRNSTLVQDTGSWGPRVDRPSTPVKTEPPEPEESSSSPVRDRRDWRRPDSAGAPAPGSRLSPHPGLPPPLAPSAFIASTAHDLGPRFTRANFHIDWSNNAVAGSSRQSHWLGGDLPSDPSEIVQPYSPAINGTPNGQHTVHPGRAEFVAQANAAAREVNDSTKKNAGGYANHSYRPKDDDAMDVDEW
ncbi:uncharacterized protein LOC62_07G009443 [Vanrija pseudolonga]|uniref:BRCT domain-containing protein n=1 Tax=Vanrija pseudolonga TaxID=143232 RepID=A0AAF0YIQ7_9TREE|nr:hypothetical protein LOC62_07G009443 [Vanrija pseudolonga]